MRELDQGTSQGTRGAGGDAPPEKYLWAARLAVLARQIQTAEGDDRQEARGEAWLLLNSAISMYLLVHSRRMGRVPQEEIEDIAANKALDLLCRIESESRELSERGSTEIAGFLSHVARNGLVDWFRTERPFDQVPIEAGSTPNNETTIAVAMGQATASPDAAVEGKEFVRALLGCFKLLKPRAQLIWFFRVLCDMSSGEVAAHPNIALKTSYVDVIQQRSRAAIAKCLRKQGQEARELPTGTFVELWKTLRPTLAARPSESSDEG